MEGADAEGLHALGLAGGDVRAACTITPAPAEDGSGTITLTIHVAGHFDRRVTSTPDAAETFAGEILRVVAEVRRKTCKSSP